MNPGEQGAFMAGLAVGSGVVDGEKFIDDFIKQEAADSCMGPVYAKVMREAFLQYFRAGVQAKVDLQPPGAPKSPS